MMKITEFFDLRAKDLSDEDFRGFSEDTLITCYFDTETIWPDPLRLPEGFDPVSIMEKAKNPGLGIRALHREGITGRSIHVAIIDQKIPQPPDNEYEVFSYNEFIKPENDCGVSMHGPAVASLLVGENCGVAPQALLHFFAIPDGVPDYLLCARIMNDIVAYNKLLPLSEMIRVVSCSFGYEDHDEDVGIQEWKYAIKNARQSGLIIVDDAHSFPLHFIGGGSLNNKDEYENQQLWLEFRDKPISEKKSISRNNIIVPSDFRAFASSWHKEGQYMYSGRGGISWSIPYLSGIIALGLQIKPNLGEEQILRILEESAYVSEENLRIINPPAFIEMIQ